MKNYFYAGILAIAVLLINSSCNKDELLDYPEMDNQESAELKSCSISPIRHYPLINDVNDYGPNKKHGSNNGAAFKGANGMEFDGGDCITLPVGSDVNNLSAFTISANVKPTQFSSHKVILSKVSPNRDFVLKYYSTTPQVHFAHVSPLKYFNTHKSNAGVLNQYVTMTATWDGSYLNLYLDGKLVASNNFAGSSPKWTGGSFCIGNLLPGSSEGFKGLIRDVRIYNRVLNSAEMVSLGNVNKPVRYYPLNNDVNDYAAGEKHGTNKGATFSGTNGMLFNGRSCVQLPVASDVNNMAQFTISANVKPTQFASHKVILSKVSPNRDFVLKYYNTTPEVHFAHVSPLRYFNSYKSNAGVLNKYVTMTATWDGTYLKLYLDGQLATSNDYSGFAPKWTGGSFTIGNLLLSSNEGFKGYIRNVKIYNSALSAEDVMYIK
ncbi:MAG: LamG domain-containing protein [Bacteroidales bacterium]|nr:LamG domain-containing protein [Bacteroidales bacterium]